MSRQAMWIVGVIGVAVVAAAVVGIALSLGTWTFVGLLIAAGPGSAIAAWALYTEVIADSDRAARQPGRWDRRR